MKERETQQSLVDKLKGNRGTLQNAVGKAFSYRQTEDDPRFWKPSTNEDGVGYAEIRFLPPKDFEEFGSPVFYHAQHYFQMPNMQWYVANCLKMNNEPCPACEILIWDDNDPKVQGIYRDRKARKYWITNIVVIKDTVKPENNNKIFLWAMTKTFYDKVLAAVNGKTPEGIKFNPFDVFEQASMKISVTSRGKGQKKKVEYSVIWSDNIKPLSDKDEVIEKVISKTYALGEISKEKKYEVKEYAVLKKLLESGFGSITIEQSDPKKQNEEQEETIEVEDAETALNEEVSVANEEDEFKFGGDDNDDVDLSGLDLDKPSQTTSKNKKSSREEGETALDNFFNN